MKNISEYLQLNTKLSSSVKKRLFSEKIIPNECCKCGIGPFWNDSPLVMQIDHLNGNNRDNRRQNLRAICPNCHSQTPTFSGKNIGRVFNMPKNQGKVIMKLNDGRTATADLIGFSATGELAKKLNKIKPKGNLTLTIREN